MITDERKIAKEDQEERMHWYEFNCWLKMQEIIFNRYVLTNDIDLYQHEMQVLGPAPKVEE
jgi:hypothetical protein